MAINTFCTFIISDSFDKMIPASVLHEDFNGVSTLKKNGNLIEGRDYKGVLKASKDVSYMEDKYNRWIKNNR
jgi:hypothetical protein